MNRNKNIRQQKVDKLRRDSEVWWFYRRHQIFWSVLKECRGPRNLEWKSVEQAATRGLATNTENNKMQTSRGVGKRHCVEQLRDCHPMWRILEPSDIKDQHEVSAGMVSTYWREMSDASLTEGWSRVWDDDHIGGCARRGRNEISKLLLGRFVVDSERLDIQRVADCQAGKLVKRNSWFFNHLNTKRSHLDYCISVWVPFKKGDIELFAKVQKRATKLIPSIKRITYTKRIKACKLPTLHYRHIRGDMIEMYKILSGKYDTAVIPRVNREQPILTDRVAWSVCLSH